MAIQKVTKRSVVTRMYEAAIDNVQHIINGVFIVAVVGALFFGYMFWVKYKNRSAQRDLGLLAMEYRLMQADKNPQWSQLYEKYKSAYDKNSGSSLAPYYIGYATQILLQQDKKNEAYALLEAHSAELQASPLAKLYALEKALILLDSSDEANVQKGLKEVAFLANDVTNEFHDTALFYLGRYYWATNQLEQARQVWQQLVDEQYDEKIAPSPWVQQVKEHLALTIA